MPHGAEGFPWWILPQETGRSPAARRRRRARASQAPRGRSSRGAAIQRARQRAATRRAATEAARAGGAARVAGAVARGGLAGVIAEVVIVTAEQIAEAIRRKRERDRELEAAAEAAVIAEKEARRAAEAELRRIVLRSDAPRPDPTGELSRGSENRRVLSLPPSQLGRIEVGTSVPEIQFPRPGPIVPELPRPEISPKSPELPEVITAPDPKPAPAPVPAPIPGIPGIGSPQPVFEPVRSPRTPVLPLGLPLPSPFSTPIGLPRLDPLRRFSPSPRTPRLPSQLTPPQGQVIPLPGPQASPQQQPQRCRPCPKKKKPTRRSKCYKGLYKEGRMSNQLKKTRWVEIDCESGRELGKSRRNVINFPSVGI